MSVAERSHRIVVVGSIPEAALARLRQAGRTTVLDGADLRGAPGVEALRDAAGLLVTGQASVDADLLDLAPRLRVVSLRAVGYDRVDTDACRARGVAVCTTPGVLDGAVADLTVLLTLAITRRQPWRCYQPGRPPAVELGTDLRGGTFGVIGLGRIGTAVARTMAAGFGMTIVHSSRRRIASEIARQVDLDELLAISDVVSLHVPAQPDAPPIIGATELRRMKPTAVLVNTSRGGLVDEDALVTALHDGAIAGAALDVTAVEPLPASSPLWDAPNLVLTPHVASATEQTRAAMAEMAVDNLLAVLDGATPHSRVA